MAGEHDVTRIVPAMLAGSGDRPGPAAPPPSDASR
jgi:hypothetical protein